MGDVAVANDDVEEARILTSAQESGVRSILAHSRALRPTNFHHVAASITLSPSQPARQRVLLLMASLSIVLLQVSALAGVTTGVDSETCSSNDVCVSGYYCARQIIGRCMFCRSPGFCAEGNGSFADWAAYNTGFGTSTIAFVPLGPSDYVSHCSKCYDGAGRYITYLDGVRLRMQGTRRSDRLALIFASLFVSLALASELRDVQICALLRHRAGSDKAQCCRISHAVLWLLEALRRFGVLPYVTWCIMTLTITRGSDALNACLNSVAALFMLEADDQIYAHGAPDWLREWCEARARPVLSDEEQRVISWSRTSGILSVWVGLPLVSFLFADIGSVPAFISMGVFTFLPPLFAEVASLHATPRQMATRTIELLLQAIFGIVFVFFVIDSLLTNGV